MEIKNHSALPQHGKRNDMLKIVEIAGFVKLKNVNNSPDKTEYKKFGEDFFDSEMLDSRLYYYLMSSFKYDGEVSTWYKNHKDEVWSDLREDEEGLLYVAVGDNAGLKFVGYIDYVTVDYDDFEINIYGGWRKDYYIFDFWIDPDGGILRASEYERGSDFYKDLESDEAYYPKKDYTLKSAIDDLISNSDKYQNTCEEEDEEEDEEEE